MAPTTSSSFTYWFPCKDIILFHNMALEPDWNQILIQAVNLLAMWIRANYFMSPDLSTHIRNRWITVIMIS